MYVYLERSLNVLYCIGTYNILRFLYEKVIWNFLRIPSPARIVALELGYFLFGYLMICLWCIPQGENVLIQFVLLILYLYFIQRSLLKEFALVLVFKYIHVIIIPAVLILGSYATGTVVTQSDFWESFAKLFPYEIIDQNRYLHYNQKLAMKQIYIEFAYRHDLNTLSSIAARETDAIIVPCIRNAIALLTLNNNNTGNNDQRPRILFDPIDDYDIHSLFEMKPTIYEVTWEITDTPGVCGICHNNYRVKHDSVGKFGCFTSHMFHQKCIYDWFKQRKDMGIPNPYSCPICSSQINFKYPQRNCI
jgi:hypothetical protein